MAPSPQPPATSKRPLRLLAVALLVFGVREPDRKPGHAAVNPIRRENLRRLSSGYWWVVAIGAVFTLARFSEAFLVLRALQVANRQPADDRQPRTEAAGTGTFADPTMKTSAPSLLQPT